MRSDNNFRFVLFTVDTHIIHAEVIFGVFTVSHLASLQNVSVRLHIEM